MLDVLMGGRAFRLRFAQNGLFSRRDFLNGPEPP